MNRGSLYDHLGAFESTQIFGTGQDILGTTKHIERWEEDLSTLERAGLQTLRYPIPWHRIETREGQFDWSWMDGPLQYMHAHGMHPIVDPLHHTSFPEWLTDGFLHPRFPCFYTRFLDQFSSRYPFIRSYTVFNEPLPTTLFCSYTGLWYPYLASDDTFVRMLLQVARAICQGSEVLCRNVRPQFVHVDTAEFHHAVDNRSLEWTTFANERRFLVADLILGRVNAEHQLYPYLCAHGASPDDLRRFEDHPAPIDVLGLDYYIHSEMDWIWSEEKGRSDIGDRVSPRRGFASIAQDYVSRYKLPIMLSETNIRGTAEERLAWLKLMEEECEQLCAEGFDLRAFCWFPSIDSTDWWNVCRQATGQTDPQGIWMLEPKTLDRLESPLSAVYSKLARGEIRAADIPDLEIGPELKATLARYRTDRCWKVLTD